jgi:hypothetical protein
VRISVSTSPFIMVIHVELLLGPPASGSTGCSEK